MDGHHDDTPAGGGAVCHGVDAGLRSRHIEHYIGALAAGALVDCGGEVGLCRVDRLEAQLLGDGKPARIDLGNQHFATGIARHHGHQNADRSAADHQRVLAGGKP